MRHLTNDVSFYTYSINKKNKITSCVSCIKGNALNNRKTKLKRKKEKNC